jgi:hypothetical protein
VLLVSKPMMVVQNVPIVVRVKQVRVSTERAFPAQKDSIAKQTMSLLHRVENVMLGNTWVVVVPSIAWTATQEPMKIELALQHVLNAMLDNIKMSLEIRHAKNALQVNT